MQMTQMLRSLVVSAGLVVGAVGPGYAQSGPGWFVPPAGGGGAAGGAPRTAPAPRVQPRPQTSQVPLLPPQIQQGPGPGPAQQQEADLPAPAPASLPPMPDLPQLPRGNAPPASVIGVLGVPDIMRVSLAAAQIEKVITERREKLNEDAQKEQAAWRDLQQGLANQRAGLTPDQIRAKERELQERITNAQKQFRDRNRIIQESLQFGLQQIEQVLSAVVRQVSESRGMNLVLHRAQVVLNVAEFDMTEQVADQLNKVLPTVMLPPDGVSPSVFSPPRPAAAATTAPTTTTPTTAAPAATPTTAPAQPPPARR